MNIDAQYQHPPTYTSTGDIESDFRFTFESYEADLADQLPSDLGASILDVGCGWGQFLYWLRLKGYSNIKGIDVGSGQVAHGVSLGLQVIQVEDPVQYLYSHQVEYDLVVMNHVIEHVSSDEGLNILSSIYSALKSGGKVVVQTPNMNSFASGAGRYIEISHVTGYTESSLCQLVRMAGFQNIVLRGNRTPLSLKPKRLALKGMQYVSRTIWKLMLLSELGTDAPKVVEKNLYAFGEKV